MTQFLYNFVGTNTHSFIPSPKQLQLIIGSTQTVSCSPFDQLSLSISLLYMPLVYVFLKGGHYLGKSNISNFSNNAHAQRSLGSQGHGAELIDEQAEPAAAIPLLDGDKDK